MARKTSGRSRRRQRRAEPTPQIPTLDYTAETPAPIAGVIAQIIGVLIILVFLGTLLYHPVRDTDIWWHLREGQHFLENGVDDKDHFTYTSVETPQYNYWVNHSWLTDILFFKLWDAFGASGLIGFRIVTVLLIALMLFEHYRRQKVNLALTALLFVPVIYVIQGRFLIRPHLISYILHTLYLLLLIYGTTGKGRHRILYALIPLQMLWANSHASFILGLMMQGAFLGGDVLQWLLKDAFPSLDREGFDKESFIHRGIIFVVSLLANTFINPFGIEVFYMIVESQQKELIQQNTTEWFSPFHPFFQGSGFFTFYIIWVGTVGAAMLASFWGRVRFAYILMAGTLFSMSLMSHRFRVDFSIFTLGAMAPVLGDLRSSVWPKVREMFFSSNRELWQAGVWIGRVGCIALICGLIYVRSDRIRTGGGIEQTLPHNLVPFMEANNITGRMWNDLMFGGWLLWFSEEPVYIDGRNFNYEVYKDYLDMQRSLEGFQEVVDKWQMDYLISRWPLSQNDGIINLNMSAMRTGEWVLVYYDRVVVVFVRNEPKFQEVIDKYGQDYLHPFLRTPTRIEDEATARVAYQDIIKQLQYDPQNPIAGQFYHQLRARFPQLFPGT